MALPILTESSDGSRLLATIYQDHENQNKHYFFPNSGSLEKDETGQPRFGMSYWTPEKETDSAGYFSGIFRLGVTNELRLSVDNYVKAGKQVAVMPVQESHLYSSLMTTVAGAASSVEKNSINCHRFCEITFA
jgi:hypothetical protein